MPTYLMRAWPISGAAGWAVDDRDRYVGRGADVRGPGLAAERAAAGQGEGTAGVPQPLVVLPCWAFR